MKDAKQIKVNIILCCRLLIQAGIDINRQSESGTALHQAALCGKTEVVRLLLDVSLSVCLFNVFTKATVVKAASLTTAEQVYTSALGIHPTELCDETCGICWPLT